ncbi:MAG: (Fe-S)-binding protein [Candidatus Woesearchaeota archaeon]
MFKKILEAFARIGGNTLYYPGCMIKFVQPEILENYKKILKIIGVDFIMLEDVELCCGSPALRGGYTNEFDSVKKRNIEIFKQYNITKVITSCPACYHIFKEEYKVNVQHITTLIVQHLDKFPRRYSGKVSYHDPCHLGRYSGIYSEPREILKHAGFEVEELRDTMDKSLCCGGGGGLKTNNAGLAKEVARLRLKQVKTNRLITSCPMCYAQLKENAKGIQVLELSEVLV